MNIVNVICVGVPATAVTTKANISSSANVTSLGSVSEEVVLTVIPVKPVISTAFFCNLHVTEVPLLILCLAFTSFAVCPVANGAGINGHLRPTWNLDDFLAEELVTAKKQTHQMML